MLPQTCGAIPEIPGICAFTGIIFFGRFELMMVKMIGECRLAIKLI